MTPYLLTLKSFYTCQEDNQKKQSNSILQSLSFGSGILPVSKLNGVYGNKQIELLQPNRMPVFQAESHGIRFPLHGRLRSYVGRRATWPHVHMMIRSQGIDLLIIDIKLCIATYAYM